jgi:hypothetical protein
MPVPSNQWYEVGSNLGLGPCSVRAERGAEQGALTLRAPYQRGGSVERTVQRGSEHSSATQLGMLLSRRHARCAGRRRRRRVGAGRQRGGRPLSPRSAPARSSHATQGCFYVVPPRRAFPGHSPWTQAAAVAQQQRTGRPSFSLFAAPAALWAEKRTAREPTCSNDTGLRGTA